jgi:hypothetical protein
LLAPAADAAKKPNLQVKSLAKPPAEVEVGKKFPLKVTVANGGPGKAKASSVGFYLGWDDHLEFGKIASLGKLATPKLAKGESKKGKPKLTAPADAPLGEPLLLVACADDTSKVSEGNEDDNCRAASGPLQVKTPLDAIGLIELEFEEREIDLDEKALYLAYASTGDPRLPERFGDAAESFDSDALRKVAANWSDLTAQTQGTLDPLFSPPIYREEGSRRAARARRGPLPDPGCVPGAGSPPAPSTSWTSFDTTHFRIWYFTEDIGSPASPADSLAGASAVAAVAEHVYNQETALWRVPLSDAAQACNGGDGRIDVYMDQVGGAKAQVVPFPPGDTLRPAWMWIGPGNFSGNEFRDAFAHEFAHVVQLAYDYAFSSGEYGWLEEAAATWAIDYVYPGDNYEHRFADDYYSKDAWAEPLGHGGAFDKIGYRDYLYLFYLSNKLGDATLGEIFANTEASASIAAIDDAAEFETEWPKFALHNLNRGDYNDYSVWDPGLNFKLPIDDSSAQPHLEVKLDGASELKTPLPGTPNPQNASSVQPKEYEWVSFSFPDDDVRKIILRDFGWTSNPTPPPAEAKVTAWYELANGDFVTEDWTGEDEKTFCRDKDEEDVVRLVLFYANGKPTAHLPSPESADIADHPKPNAEIEATDFCEYPPYSGTFTGSATYTPVQLGGTANATWSGNLQLEPDDPAQPYWRMTTGVMNYSVSGHINDCDFTGSGAIGLPTSDMEPVNMLLFFPGDPDTEYQLTVPMPYAGTVTATNSGCEEPTDNGTTFDWFVNAGYPAMVSSTDPCCFDPKPVSEGGVLSGSASGGGDGGTPAQTWTWNLQPG